MDRPLPVPHPATSAIIPPSSPSWGRVGRSALRGGAGGVMPALGGNGPMRRLAEPVRVPGQIPADSQTPPASLIRLRRRSGPWRNQKSVKRLPAARQVSDDTSKKHKALYSWKRHRHFRARPRLGAQETPDADTRAGLRRLFHPHAEEAQRAVSKHGDRMRHWAKRTISADPSEGWGPWLALTTMCTR